MKYQMLNEEGKPETFTALLTNPLPELPQNITQEQAVIAALVKACKSLISECIEHDKEYDHVTKDGVFQQAQDALALADTLKKGES